MISGGTFDVKIVAGSDVSYSIMLGGQFACTLDLGIKHEMISLLTRRKEIDMYTEQATLLREKISLLKRKKMVESRLVTKSDTECKTCEAKMDELDLALDTEDNEDAWTLLVDQINDLKLEHDKSCQLLSLR